MTLYRYINPVYADRLVNNGEILFRSLSYYRALYDDNGVRSDPNEGALVHRPEDGLKITMTKTGEVLPVEGSLRVDAHYNDIFVCCLSVQRTDRLAKEFGGVCVEIFKPQPFLGQIRRGLNALAYSKTRFISGPVTYYEHHEDVGIKWAFPDRIAFKKPKSMEWQNEYRIAFAINDAFKFQGGDFTIAKEPPSPSADHASIKLSAGSLAKYCRILV